MANTVHLSQFTSNFLSFDFLLGNFMLFNLIIGVTTHKRRVMYKLTSKSNCEFRHTQKKKLL